MSLAVATALHIERDILARRLESGTFFGTCAELGKRYDVGRQVTREAIRLIEMRGMARARPGPGGGLIVTGMGPEIVAASAGVHLILTRTVGRVDSVELRCALGAASVALLCTQPDAARSKLLDWFNRMPLGPIEAGKRACHLIGFPIALAVASGNIVARLFSITAGATAEDLIGPETPWLVDAEVAAWSRQCEMAIIDAIGRREMTSAQQLLGVYIRKLDAMGVVAPSRRASEEVSRVISRRRAGQIARSIINDLRVRRANGEANNVALGTIDTLCEVERTSRATAVQAVRMLEMAGVIRVRSGRGQGYYAKPIGLDLIVCQLQDCLSAQPGTKAAARSFRDVFLSALEAPQTSAATQVMATVLRHLVSAEPAESECLAELA